MNLKHEILLYLIENKGKPVTIKAISDIVQKDYKNVYDAVQTISDSVSIDKKSNSSYISFSPVLTTDSFIVENYRKERVSRYIALILKDIEEVKNPFFSAILFGSYAKGNHTKHSDIDICLIESSPEIVSRLRIHPKIELHNFSCRDFTSMVSSKQKNVGHEIMNHGVILHGIEPFYRLMQYG
ncbi:nucleotidyltransferase domain-containing protein [Candidatus Woesearchaeota archaeon]|nr:nucleotidyltransferase domain-containing protein [Candidatus Woesearchaeota archaeon]